MKNLNFLDLYNKPQWHHQDNQKISTKVFDLSSYSLVPNKRPPLVITWKFLTKEWSNFDVIDSEVTML